MRCIAHIWNSHDCDGNQILLCLSPLDSLVGGAPVESFRNEKSLFQRLTTMGVEISFIKKNLSNLRRKTSITWENIEISRDDFESFGKNSPDEHLAHQTGTKDDPWSSASF
jgi:hypothetical protein